MRHNRALHTSIVDVFPVHVCEPLVRLDGCGATLDVAKPLRGVHGAEAGDEFARDVGHGGGKAEVTFYYSDYIAISTAVLLIEGVGLLLVDLDGILIPKRRLPNQELIYQNPQRPPIHRTPMPRISYHLGREVLRRSTQRIRLLVLDLFREAEVDEFQVALGIYEYVLGLEIAVCDTHLLVEELEDEDYFCGVEFGGCFVEAAGAAEVGEDFAAGAVVELVHLCEYGLCLSKGRDDAQACIGNRSLGRRLLELL
jgi:hypothetical protein